MNGVPKSDIQSQLDAKYQNNAVADPFLLSLEEEEEDPSGSSKYNVYQLKSQGPPSLNGQRLQDTYGTGSLPSYRWVTNEITGEREYVPSPSPSDTWFAEDPAAGQPPEGLEEPDLGQIASQLAIGTASQVGQQAARQVGSAMVDPYLDDMSWGEKAVEGLKSTFGSTPDQQIQSVVHSGNNILDTSGLSSSETIIPELANRKVAEATGNLELYNELQNSGSFRVEDGVRIYDNSAVQGAESASNLTAQAITQTSTTPSYFENVGDRLWGQQASSTWANAAGSAVFALGVNLAMGASPKQAVKSAGGSMIGTAIGNALLPGIGGVIGGVLGSMFGGSCFLTTAVCERRGEADDGPTLTKLRVFRDSFVKVHYPEEVVRYYDIAPEIISKVGDDDAEWNWIEARIDEVIERLDEDDNPGAYKHYKALVDTLSDKHLIEEKTDG